MDGFQIVENLDSLWFFSSVFSSRTLDLVAFDGTDESAIQEEENLKPINQLKVEVKDEKNQSQTSSAETSLQRCPRCGEFSLDTETPVVRASGTEMVEIENDQKPKRRTRRSSIRRRRRRRRGSKGSSFQGRNNVLGELELGFNGEMEFGSDWFSDDERKCWSYHENYVNMNMMMMKMPPLDDGMAMKEHLKSWAYAVACTVR